MRAVVLGSVRWYLRLQPAVQRLLDRKAGRLAPELERAAGRRRPSDRILAQSGAADGQCRRQCGAHAGPGARRRTGQRAAAPAGARARGAAARRSTPTPWPPRRIRAGSPRRCGGRGRSRPRRVMAANNAHPPMTLRVDLSRIDRDAYLALAARRPASRRAPRPGRPRPWSLRRRCRSPRCRTSRDGWVSVQDAGAQLAAVLLDAQPGMRVLDACAAPGGKTLHILERAAVTASWSRPTRMPRACSACATTWSVVNATPSWWSRTCATGRAPDGAVAAAAGPRRLRSHPAGCAVFGHRRHPPPPGYPAAAA